MILEILLLLIVVLLWKLSKQRVLQIPPKFEVSPTNVIFAFDLHQVLVHPDHVGMLRLLLGPEGRNFLLTVLRPHILFSAVRVVGGFFWRNLISKQGVVVEELFFILADLHPELAQHTKLFTIVANCFYQDTTMFSVVKKLRDRGYSVYLLSNIGARFFEDMKVKYPFLADYFDGAYCATHTDGYVKKPNLGYYEIFVRRFCSQIEEQGTKKTNQKVIVFVDDKIANLQAALDCATGDRFYPVFFKDSDFFEKQMYRWKFLS